MPKRRRDIENKENEPTPFNPMKKSKTEDSESLVDEEENEPYPIASIIENNDGTIHPTNKQYIKYENTDLNAISRTARFWSRKYLKVLRHVNPDAYDMYVHNDFVCYGELEVIENCLIDLHKGIFIKDPKKINSILAFRRLEGLTIVLDSSSNFLGMDDGNRFVEIVRVIGACYVTILRGLLPKAMFDNQKLNEDDTKKVKKISQQLPNFKDVIKRALILGHMFLQIGNISTAYTNILQTIYCNWLVMTDENENDENVSQVLKHVAGIKKNAYKESFNFVKELEIYSKNNPGLGGHSHDLRKWSKTQRNLYSLDNTDDNNDDDESFWSRL